jgi:hypothetical protein
MSELTIDGGAKSDSSNQFSGYFEDEAETPTWPCELKGKLVHSSTISQQFIYSFGLRSRPSPLSCAGKRT